MQQMNMPGNEADRSLIEDAVKLVLTGAPAGWTRVTAEFDVSPSPTATRAWAITGSGSMPVAVPAGAQALVVEHARRVGAPWHRVVIDVDIDGTLSMRTDPPAATAAPNAPAAARPSRRGVWVWALAAVLSVAVLAVAIVGRDRGDGPSLRPMAASESMSDDEARAVTENTVRAWYREGNERHVANLVALTCPDPVGVVAADIRAAREGHLQGGQAAVVAFGKFLRRGPVWTIYTHRDDDYSSAIASRIIDGELRVCAMGSAAVP